MRREAEVLLRVSTYTHVLSVIFMSGVLGVHGMHTRQPAQAGQGAAQLVYEALSYLSY